MAKSGSRPKAVGVICVRFPPPVPKNLGSDVTAAVRAVLGPRDDCSALNTGALGGPPGWCLDLRIAKAAETADAAAKVSALLASRGVPEGTTVEVSERRGPVAVTLADPTPAGLAGLAFPAEDAAAEVFVDLPPQPGGLGPLVAELTAALAGRGTVAHQVQLATRASMTLKLGDACKLAECLPDVMRTLGGPAAAGEPGVAVYTHSRPVVAPLAT